MGCGSSKEAVATPTKEATVPPVTEKSQGPIPPTTVGSQGPTKPTLREINNVEQPSQLQQAKQTLTDDPDAEDPSTLMAQAASLGWLVQLASHPEYGQLTPDQLTAQVAAPATAARRCRYLDVAGPEAMGGGGGGPVYWVWLEASWQRSVKELVGIVEGHIKFMEPAVDPSRLGIWLECVCGHASASPDGRHAARAAAREWLTNTAAKPTLMCMERVSPRAPVHLTETDKHMVQHGDLNGSKHGGMDNGMGVLHKGEELKSAGGMPETATHAPVMMLFRSSHGLHGFHKAQFDCMHVTHLD